MSDAGLSDESLALSGRQALQTLGVRLAALFLVTAAIGVLVAPRHSSLATAVLVSAWVLTCLVVGVGALRRLPRAVAGLLLAIATLVGLVLLAESSRLNWSASHQVAGWIVAGIAGGAAASWGAGWGLGYFVMAAGTSLVVERAAGGPAPLFTFLGSLTYYVGAALVHVLARRGYTLTETEIVAAKRAGAAKVVAQERWQARRQMDRRLHDTVLVTLSALAHGGSGLTSQEVRTACAESAQLLRDSLAVSETQERQSGDRGESSVIRGLRRIVGRSEASGLRVQVYISGEVSASQAVETAVREALEAAFRQCLDNIQRHAEVAAADVMVNVTGRELVVLVVDQGRGFDPTNVSEGRLGLRASVVERLTEVGGRTTLWSTPGRGTSVMLRVPLGTDSGATPAKDKRS